jgi:hypothetical protein
MFTHPNLTGQLARERQRDVLARADQRLIPHFRDLAGGALGAPSRQAADEQFSPAHPPGGASLMNHTAAASIHPIKGGRPWRP